MTSSEYNRDQLEAIRMVRDHLKDLPSKEIRGLTKMIEPYLQFRTAVADFHKRHLSGICTDKCFTDKTSACCGREGIATFFADVVINILSSPPEKLDIIEQLLLDDGGGFKCVYLTHKGCLWKMKPVVCEMFLCEHAKNCLAEENDSLLNEWKSLREREKDFTWPDRRVLFDELEEFFIHEGYDSPLMYFHKSPGLLKVKKKRDIIKNIRYRVYGIRCKGNPKKP